MKKLAIILEGFNNTPESWELLGQRGYVKISDNTIGSNNKRLVNKHKHTTPLINVEFEEYEYE
ncbi:MAG: hypothetical protein ACRD38_01320 [Nitrososphaerales archaeon]